MAVIELCLHECGEADSEFYRYSSSIVPRAGDLIEILCHHDPVTEEPITDEEGNTGDLTLFTYKVLRVVHTPTAFLLRAEEFFDGSTAPHPVEPAAVRVLVEPYGNIAE